MFAVLLQLFTVLSGAWTRKGLSYRPRLVQAALSLGFHDSVDLLLLEVCDLERYAV